MDVSPEKQNLLSVFGRTQFSIDFYQRDYKWTEAPVKRLLDDIFFKFNEAYKKDEGLHPSSEIINSEYPWYYLNTYVTNKVEGKVFIVDGQQRLTTLSLMAIALRHLAKEKNIGENSINWITGAIAGAVASGQKFWIDHEGHRETQKAIYDDEIKPELRETGITSKNMVDNFEIIKKFLKKELTPEHKLETFIYYFLERLILIELSVNQTEVPMVFEVINDRGVKLMPYEILKGKLLGKIKKSLLNERKYNELWEDAIGSINHYGKDEADNFFRNYLKAQFADSRKDGQNFDGDYHREIFTDEFQKHLSLAHDQKEVLKFLDEPFKYFSRLYVKYLKGYESDSKSGFLYNKAVGIDGASMLVLSACAENDDEDEEKLKQIPLELDRLYSLLQLQGAYDSNAFQQLLYKISKDIRGKPAEEIRPAFDLHLIEELDTAHDTKNEISFNYKYFRPIGNFRNKTFKRYFLARVEEFFADNLGQEMTHNIYDLTRKNGFHIEHILSKNKDNLKLFNDEEQFEIERNRLGALLLLKGKDNQSSGNETFSDKLRTYSGCSLAWNETLTENFYKANTDFKNLNNKFDLSLEPMKKFGADEVEIRQKILFKIAEQIWK